MPKTLLYHLYQGIESKIFWCSEACNCLEGHKCQYNVLWDSQYQISFTAVWSEEDDRAAGARILPRCDIITFSSGCLQHSSKISWKEGEAWLNVQYVYNQTRNTILKHRSKGEIIHSDTGRLKSWKSNNKIWIIFSCKPTRPLSPSASLPWCLRVSSPGMVSQAEVTNSSTTLYCITSLCFITFQRAADTRRKGGARSWSAAKGRLASVQETKHGAKNKIK